MLLIEFFELAVFVSSSCAFALTCVCCIAYIRVCSLNLMLRAPACVRYLLPASQSKALYLGAPTVPVVQYTLANWGNHLSKVGFSMLLEDRMINNNMNLDISLSEIVNCYHWRKWLSCQLFCWHIHKWRNIQLNWKYHNDISNLWLTLTANTLITILIWVIFVDYRLYRPTKGCKNG